MVRMRQDENLDFAYRFYANFGRIRLAGDFIVDKHLPGCFNRIDEDVERMCPRRQNATFDFLMVGAYDQRCVRSGVRYRQLDWLDKLPSFNGQSANWNGKARLLHRGLI